MYPTFLVFPNGASIGIRYPEPRCILKLPLDLNDCTPEEREKRLLRRRPRARLIIREEIEETFDRNNYTFLLKKT
ncbi:unnamed protein product [Protopolystoma xenopodis]|uniref:39S ribosomal protein L55, mitochondrial n=1 Tax=Protopolystoma xenopodis TaxID=117903 RepID=A0A3S5CLM8_9PLAT|nr:unnamed protein product [Protopolystoma xenopodis]